MIRLLSGDVRAVLPTLPDASVQCVVTSPPYYALRSYLHADDPDKAREMGSEPTPEAFIAELVAVFREVRRVMRDDAVAFVNLGDSYQDKQLQMIPARVALALQADGWILRSDVIWAKPNPMPESCRDRPTSAHEHVFLLTKRSRYFYDGDAVREPLQDSTIERGYTAAKLVNGGTPKEHSNTDKMVRQGKGWWNNAYVPAGRSCRNVWTIATHAYPQAHFATFPPELAERCIRAGSRPGDTILDPFSGAGTALLVADRLGRDAIGIDLSHAYVSMAKERLIADCPLFADISPPAAEDPEDERMADLFAGDEYERLPLAAPKLHVPSGWDIGPGAHGTIHRNGRTMRAAAD